MKITDLPKNSKAAKSLSKLSDATRNESLRCAEVALSMAQWCHETYPDEPAQWIRCEAVLKDILRDNFARIEWFKHPSARPGGE